MASLRLPDQACYKSRGLVVVTLRQPVADQVRSESPDTHRTVYSSESRRAQRSCPVSLKADLPIEYSLPLNEGQSLIAARACEIQRARLLGPSIHQFQCG